MIFYFISIFSRYCELLWPRQSCSENLKDLLHTAGLNNEYYSANRGDKQKTNDKTKASFGNGREPKEL